MASFNKVLLMGNLTRDPQLKYLPSQTAVVEFGIACNRKFKGANGEEREEVTFVDVASFDFEAPRRWPQESQVASWRGLQRCLPYGRRMFRMVIRIQRLES